MPANTPYNESELLARIAEGDASVYPYLHDTYYNSLVYFSINIIQDQQQAEDIVVEALVKLWQTPARFESLGKLRSYLFTLVRNASLNHLKHMKVRAKSQLTLLPEEQVDAHLEVLVVESDLMHHIHQEIYRMPEAYRQVLELLYIDGLSSAEAAERLGISMDNLRQRKGRAIKELKNELIRKGLSELPLFFIFF